MAFRIDGPDGPSLSILDDETGYQLFTSDAKKCDQKGVYFKIPLPDEKWIAPSNGRVYVHPDNRPMATGRDLSKYAPRVHEIVYRVGDQCLEVGPCMGELMQKWIKMYHDGLMPKPIAIEHADYDNIVRLLDEGERVLNDWPTLQRISVLRQRCLAVLDPVNVRLYRMRCSAAAALPELQGQADILVDHYASLYYPKIERPELANPNAERNELAFQRQIIGFHNRLLKPGGRSIVHPTYEFHELLDTKLG
jgi:hypothetical protein